MNTYLLAINDDDGPYIISCKAYNMEDAGERFTKDLSDVYTIESDNLDDATKELANLGVSLGYIYDIEELEC